MTNEERIAELEAQIEELHAKQADLYKQLTQTQIDQWQGRIEDLEVQMHLGAMEANDKLTALMDQLRTKWSGTRRQLEDATSTASGVADTLRAGFESAYTEIRKALLEGKSQLS